MCGTAPWEWEEDPQAYVPVEMMCWGCYYKDSARKDARSEMPGTRVELMTPGQLSLLENQPIKRPRRRRRRDG